VPNKTIYVSDGDLPLYQRAQELAGGNLSSAISSALRRYVNDMEGSREGFDEVVVRVGPSNGKRKVRFTGVQLGEWVNSVGNRVETFRVYRSRTGKFVLYISRSPNYTMVDREGKPAGIRSWLGIGDYITTSISGDTSIEIIDTLEALQERIPPELYELVARVANQPAVEDLDI